MIKTALIKHDVPLDIFDRYFQFDNPKGYSQAELSRLHYWEYVKTTPAGASSTKDALVTTSVDKHTYIHNPTQTLMTVFGDGLKYLHEMI